MVEKGNTELPWRLAENDPTLLVTEAIDSENNCTVIADMLVSSGVNYDTTIANANLIVTAVNTYPAVEGLVKALESVAAFGDLNLNGEWKHGLRDIIRSQVDAAKDALSRFRGEAK